MGKKREVVRRSRRQNQKRIPLIVTALVAVVLGGAGGYGLYSWWRTGPPGEAVPSLGNAHIPSPDFPHIPYNSDPPTSGPHLPYLASWGVHTEEVPKELQVHNLEDGGVMVQYHCLKANDCSALVDQLAVIVRDYDRVILAPYRSMDRLIALTAWTRIKRLDRVDEKAIRRFIKAYINIDHHQ